METNKISSAIFFFRVDPRRLTMTICSLLPKKVSTNHEDFAINQTANKNKVDLSEVTAFPAVIDNMYYFNSEEKAIAFIHSMLAI